MPSYRAEQYELHVVQHLVQPASAAEAIERVFQGETQLADDSSEYLEPADAYGVVLPPEIIDELRSRV